MYCTVRRGYEEELYYKNYELSLEGSYKIPLNVA